MQHLGQVLAHQTQGVAMHSMRPARGRRTVRIHVESIIIKDYGLGDEVSGQGLAPQSTALRPHQHACTRILPPFQSLTLISREFLNIPLRPAHNTVRPSPREDRIAFQASPMLEGKCLYVCGAQLEASDTNCHFKPIIS